MSRRTAIGVVATALVGSVLLPLGSSTAHATAPAAAPSAPGAGPAGPAAHATAGTGSLTPEMKSEIDGVLAEAQRAARLAPRGTLSPRALAQTEVRCADLEGQRYCLHTGWTDKSEAQVVRSVAAGATQVSARSAGRETTGDLSQVDALRQFNALSPGEKRKAQRQELTQAAQSVAKVWLLRHQMQGVPLPDNFLARHPEVKTDTRVSARGATDSTNARKRPRDYPQRDVVLKPDHVTAQNRTYWCGPAAMQMIGWGWRDNFAPQRRWANRLGTTTSGTAITEMVRVTNVYTGWDNPRRAGRYITLDISDWSFPQWWQLQMRHYHDYRAPIILHPVLLKQFYPYLDDDASGHFQVGRGYDKNGRRAAQLIYFEPWNQQKFDPSEPYIKRNQRRAAYRSYRANQAHFQHNIGV